MLDAIINRRACRAFKDTPVEKEKIEEIVQAGLLAPSGMGRQTPVIIAISDKKVRDALAFYNKKYFPREVPEDFDSFYGAPVILLVIAHKDGLSIYDGSASIENMLLEATNLGLGSCWIHRAKEELEDEECQKLLSFTGLNFDDYVGIGHVIIGYPVDGFKPNPKIIKEGRVFYK